MCMGGMRLSNKATCPGKILGVLVTDVEDGGTGIEDELTGFDGI